MDDAVARAIYEARFPNAGQQYGEPAWDAQPEPVKDVWRRCAIAAAGAGRQVPNGWALVPADPTPAMIDAAWRVTEAVPSDQRMAVLLSSPRTAHSVKMLRR